METIDHSLCVEAIRRLLASNYIGHLFYPHKAIFLPRKIDCGQLIHVIALGQWMHPSFLCNFVSK